MPAGQRKHRAANVIIDEAPAVQGSNKTPMIYAQNGVSRATDNAQDTTAVLQGHIADLTRQLQEAKNQKEDLANQVRYLEGQQGSSLFDSNMVFSELAFSAQKQLTLRDSQLDAARGECDSLKEDLKGHREARRTAENLYREESKKAAKLDKDLKFYMEQSARAMSDRDQARWEAEELRKLKAELEARASKAESSADSAIAEQQDLQSRLTEATATIQDLSKKAKDCERIPGLEAQIKQSEDCLGVQAAEIEGLERDLESVRGKCADLERELVEVRTKTSELDTALDKTRAKAAANANAASERIRKLQARVDELEEANADLEARVEEAEGNLAASQAEAETVATEADIRFEREAEESMQRQSTMESSYTMRLAELEMELESKGQALREMTDRCEQATTEKVQTLLRASQAEQTAEQAYEETSRLLDQMNDLKDREARVRQEKESALLQVNALQEQLRGGGAPAGIPSTRWVPRLWGGAQPMPKTTDDSPEKAKTSQTGSSPQGSPAAAS